MAKIRIRDHKLPENQKTKKFQPLKKKNKILKFIITTLFIGNLIQSYLLFYN
jgi:hypothetical protein